MKTLDVPWCLQLSERMAESVEWRRYCDPHASEYEDEIGSFIEDMEPQVDGAVRMLRAKGYSTVGSGLTREACKQYVQWMAPTGERAEVPEDAFAGMRMEYEVRRFVPANLPHGFVEPWMHAITLVSPRVLTFKEWTLVWNAFAERMPNLGRKALPCPTPIAVRFRENFVGWLGKRMRP